MSLNDLTFMMNETASFINPYPSKNVTDEEEYGQILRVRQIRKEEQRSR
jgi:hypothetical protein